MAEDDVLAGVDVSARGGDGSSMDVSAAGRKGRGWRADDAEEDRYAGRSGPFESLESDEGPGPQRSVEGWIIFVTGIHEEAQEDDVVDKFAEYGEVKNIHMNLDRRTGFVKGYALIEYGTRKEAEAAIHAMNGQTLLGKAIKVDWAFLKADRR